MISSVTSGAAIPALAQVTGTGFTGPMKRARNRALAKRWLEWIAPALISDELGISAVLQRGVFHSRHWAGLEMVFHAVLYARGDSQHLHLFQRWEFELRCSAYPLTWVVRILGAEWSVMTSC